MVLNGSLQYGMVPLISTPHFTVWHAHTTLSHDIEWYDVEKEENPLTIPLLIAFQFLSPMPDIIPLE